MTRKPLEMDECLLVQDVAEIMRVTSKTVRRWINSKKLKAFKMGRLLRVTPAELQRFIEENMQ